MVEIEFLGPIKMHNLKLEAANLSEVKEKLGEYAQLGEWLKICAVAVNDEIASSLDVPLKYGDKISILPPVCGG
nr:MoaD/ThiS family protein [uncultured Campylobacter sp.]